MNAIRTRIAALIAGALAFFPLPLLPPRVSHLIPFPLRSPGRRAVPAVRRPGAR